MYLYCWSGFWASHFTSQFILLAHKSQSDKYVNEEIHDEEQHNKIYHMTTKSAHTITSIHGLWTLIIVSYYLVLMYSQFFVISAYDTHSVSVGDPFLPTSLVEGRFTVAGFTRMPRLTNRIQTDQAFAVAVAVFVGVSVSGVRHPPPLPSSHR